MKVDPRLVALAPFTAPRDLPKEKLKERCEEWNKIAQQLFTDDAYQNILQIMMSFFLNRFKDLSIEEVKTMWKFDLAKTKAGRQLYSMGDKNGEQRSIPREIDRVKNLYSKGIFTDSAYKELIVPLKNELAKLEAMVPPDAESAEFEASAVS